MAPQRSYTFDRSYDGRKELVSLPWHALHLASCLNEARGQAWQGVAEWLVLAGSITSVQIDTTQHDANFGYCSAADRFDLARQELLRKFAGGLTIFMFVWGALEAAIDVIKPPKAPRGLPGGKIANTCRHLAKRFEFRPVIPELRTETLEFLEAANSCPGYEKVKLPSATLKHSGVAGAGLQSVYKVRNLFAHGALSFPMPDEDHRPVSGHAAMVFHATRVVLLSIQMLALAHTDESDDLIPWDSEDGESDETALSLVLRSCHLVQDDECPQSPLF